MSNIIEKALKHDLCTSAYYPTKESATKDKEIMAYLQEKRLNYQKMLHHIYQPKKCPKSVQKHLSEKLPLIDILPRIESPPKPKNTKTYRKQINATMSPGLRRHPNNTNMAKKTVIINYAPKRSYTQNYANDKLKSGSRIMREEYVKAASKYHPPSSKTSLNTLMSKVSISNSSNTEVDIQLIDNYEIISTIGAGCFGTVNLAKSNKGLPVAIKTIKKDFAVKMNQQEHLFSEKALMMKLSCPFIVKW